MLGYRAPSCNDVEEALRAIMMRNSAEDFGERERLLLMAAYLHPQQTVDLITANCWRVLRQAMLWGGARDEQIDALGDQGDHPAVEEWYRTLIELARREPACDAMLWIAGNLGNATDAPAWPAFNSCGLTERGLEYARQLLAAFPQYRI